MLWCHHFLDSFRAVVLVVSFYEVPSHESSTIPARNSHRPEVRSSVVVFAGQSESKDSFGIEFLRLTYKKVREEIVWWILGALVQSSSLFFRWLFLPLERGVILLTETCLCS